MRRYGSLRADFGPPLLAGLIVSLYLAFLGGIILWTEWQDYQDTNFGVHGTMTLGACDERSGENGRFWECTGKFRADDGGLRIEPISVTLTNPPGEVAYGWVRDATDEDLNPITERVPRETFETWRFWAIVVVVTPLVIGLLAGLGRALSW